MVSFRGKGGKVAERTAEVERKGQEKRKEKCQVWLEILACKRKLLQFGRAEKTPVGKRS